MNNDPNEQTQAKGPSDGAAEALIEESRGLPLVWLIPLVALIAGIWLAYKTLSEQGPLITLTFKEAYGLEAGKTKVKFKDIEVGQVETVRLSDDLSHVIVTTRMEQSVASHLGAESRFWIVKPQFGLSGVSGLETLMAGNYIGVEFGKGRPARSFTGLEHAPKISAETPGRSYSLEAKNAGSVQEGKPIYFRDLQAGRVVDVRLADDKQSVTAEIFIDAPFDHLVTDSSRFWLTSAIDASLTSQGFDLKIGSLLALLSGGIAFDTPDLNDPKAKPSEAGRKFVLHKDFASIAEGAHFHKLSFLLHFADSVRGLTIGAPVEIRGIKVGSVTNFWLDFNPETKSIRIPVVIDIDPEMFFTTEQVNRLFAQNQVEMGSGRRPVMEKLVQQGLRARLKTGSLVTGQLFVDLDVYTDITPREIVYGGPYPELPTLPSVVGELQKDLTDILAKVKALPLDKIGNELLGTLKGANQVANGPELKESLRSLDAALKDLRKMAQTADQQLVVLATGMEKSLNSARKVLEQLEPGSPMAVNLNQVLEQLSSAARSIRTLSDYLDRHPEALLKGKSGYGGKP